jgi:hypothetical protein
MNYLIKGLFFFSFFSSFLIYFVAFKSKLTKIYSKELAIGAMILLRNVIETNKQLKTKGTRENVVNLHELFVGLLYNLPKVNN